MNVDAMGNIVCDPTEFVILTGIGKTGKAYQMLKLDNQRGFDIGRNEVAVKKLQAAGVRVVHNTPTPVAK